MASLSTEPALGCKFLVSVFDIPESLLPDFYEREEEFKIISAKFQELDGTSGEEVGGWVGGCGWVVGGRGLTRWFV